MAVTQSTMWDDGEWSLWLQGLGVVLSTNSESLPFIVENHKQNRSCAWFQPVRLWGKNTWVSTPAAHQSGLVKNGVKPLKEKWCWTSECCPPLFVRWRSCCFAVSSSCSNTVCLRVAGWPLVSPPFSHSDWISGVCDFFSACIFSGSLLPLVCSNCLSASPPSIFEHFFLSSRSHSFPQSSEHALYFSDFYIFSIFLVLFYAYFCHLFAASFF